jgi:hypothetical protein
VSHTYSFRIHKDKAAKEKKDTQNFPFLAVQEGFKESDSPDDLLRTMLASFRQSQTQVQKKRKIQLLDDDDDHEEPEAKRIKIYAVPHVLGMEDAEYEAYLGNLRERSRQLLMEIEGVEALDSIRRKRKE